jgi:small-conductance mechanosensitive channel
MGAPVESAKKKILVKLLRGLVFLGFILTVVITFKQNHVIHAFESFDLTVLLIVKALLFFQFIRIVDWFVSNVVINNYYAAHNSRDKDDDLSLGESVDKAQGLVQSIFYTIVTLFALNHFHVDFSLFERNFGDEIVKFNLSNIVNVILVILVARLLVWGLMNIFLFKIYQAKKIDVGSQFAVNQLIKYVIYLITIIVCFNVLGIDMSLILGGAAALLVGVGLGLQQTFNDFVSGLVILFERSVSVGDILEFDSTIGIVRKIGIRASTIETRGNTSIVVPNHMLVNEKVVNWNHYNQRVRFNVDVGVAYGSDTTLVKKLLLKSLEENPYVEKFPAPFVRFLNFGSSSLDFSLYFFSRNLLVIEDIKSDIRLKIDFLFREHNISIPFPQSDIHIKRD